MIEDLIFFLIAGALAFVVVFGMGSWIYITIQYPDLKALRDRMRRERPHYRSFGESISPELRILLASGVEGELMRDAISNEEGVILDTAECRVDTHGVSMELVEKEVRRLCGSSECHTRDVDALVRLMVGSELSWYRHSPQGMNWRRALLGQAVRAY